MIVPSREKVVHPWLIEASQPTGELSQRYYHVPADWLRASNEIVILEEQAASPAKVELQVRNT
jgi:hypothetical protein